MNKEYNITITNGVGTESILNGNYSATANVNGYNNASINPDSVSVVDGTNTYSFTIAAEGTLTLHVSEDGTSTGTPVVGATFVRTDAEGNEYGTAITTDASGNAVFANVPYGENAPAVYFKQTASDGEHEYSISVTSVTLTNQTQTEEIQNALPASRTINLTDANYANLPLTGTITLN